MEEAAEEEEEERRTRRKRSRRRSRRRRRVEAAGAAAGLVTLSSRQLYSASSGRLVPSEALKNFLKISMMVCTSHAE